MPFSGIAFFLARDSAKGSALGTRSGLCPETLPRALPLDPTKKLFEKSFLELQKLYYY